MDIKINRKFVIKVDIKKILKKINTNVRQNKLDTEEYLFTYNYLLNKVELLTPFYEQRNNVILRMIEIDIVNMLLCSCLTSDNIYDTDYIDFHFNTINKWTSEYSEKSAKVAKMQNIVNNKREALKSYPEMERSVNKQIKELTAEFKNGSFNEDTYIQQKQILDNRNNSNNASKETTLREIANIEEQILELRMCLAKYYEKKLYTINKYCYFDQPLYLQHIGIDGPVKSK